MDFFKEAVRTLETLVTALHENGSRTTWRNRRPRQREPPRQPFDRKRFLTTRLKIRPCNQNRIQDADALAELSASA